MKSSTTNKTKVNIARVQSEEFPVNKVYSADENHTTPGVMKAYRHQDVSARAAIGAYIEFYDSSFDVPKDLSVKLYERDCYPNIIIPDGMHEHSNMNGSPTLNQELKDIIEGNHPGYKVNASITVNSDAPGYNLLNNKFDNARTYQEQLLEFARDLRVEL